MNTQASPQPAVSGNDQIPKPAGRKPDGIWPTFWAFVPYEEAKIALSEAGTIGFAVYVSVCIRRFLTAPKYRAAFFCSEENLSALCGISERRLRDPLRKLEKAKLIKIARPQGIDKVRHQANKITLLPVFLNGNEIKARPDKSSGRDKTKRPVESGQNTPPILSVNAELPLTGVTHPAVSDTTLVGVVSTADELRDRTPQVSNQPRYITRASIRNDLVKDGINKSEAETAINEFIYDNTLIQTADGRYHWKTG